MSDGTRTRDFLDHNQVLYQLSYTHHATPAPGLWPLHCISVPPVLGERVAHRPVARAAAAWACSVVGPGGGTNRVLR